MTVPGTKVWEREKMLKVVYLGLPPRSFSKVFTSTLSGVFMTSSYR